VKYPFADLKAETRIFFEGFQKILANREYTAAEGKLLELARIFASQNSELEKAAKQGRYSNYLAIAGIVIGICGIILPYLFSAHGG